VSSGTLEELLPNAEDCTQTMLAETTNVLKHLNAFRAAMRNLESAALEDILV
jgi:hypothetical protein